MHGARSCSFFLTLFLFSNIHALFLFCLLLTPSVYFFILFLLCPLPLTPICWPTRLRTVFSICSSALCAVLCMSCSSGRSGRGGHGAKRQHQRRLLLLPGAELPRWPPGPPLCSLSRPALPRPAVPTCTRLTSSPHYSAGTAPLCLHSRPRPMGSTRKGKNKGKKIKNRAQQSRMSRAASAGRQSL